MKHLIFSMVVCLAIDVAAETTVITPAKVPDLMSVSFFPGRLELEFRVLTQGKNDQPNWQKMGETQKVSVAKAHCLIKVRRANQAREITFDLNDNMLVISDSDWQFMKVELDQFGFAVEATTMVVNEHITGWVCGGTEYYSNPLFFQFVGGKPYFGRAPEDGKAIALSPLLGNPAPFILFPKIDTDFVNFSVNLIDITNSHKFEYQIVDGKGGKSGWYPLAEKIQKSVDFSDSFTIQVRGSSNEPIELFFIKNGSFEVSGGTVKEWGEKFPNLALTIDAKGSLVGKPIEVVGWLVNKTILPTRGPVWIKVVNGNMILTADKVYTLQVKDESRKMTFEPCFGEKGNKDPPSLKVEPPKKTTPAPPGAFEVLQPRQRRGYFFAGTYLDLYRT